MVDMLNESRKCLGNREIIDPFVRLSAANSIKRSVDLAGLPDGTNVIRTIREQLPLEYVIRISWN